MADSIESSSESAYDIAVARLRAYQANGARIVEEREAALDAIPGFREARDQAFKDADPKGGLQVAHALIPFEEQMSEVEAEFDGRYSGRQEELNAVAAAFAALDETEIRRLFALPKWPHDDQTIEFHAIARMLMLAGNRNAVLPLIERLQAEVNYERPPVGNRFLNFVGDLLTRDLILSAQETHRVLERTMTIRVLGRLGDRRAEAAIRPFLQDPDEKVRDAARKALTGWEATS